MRAALALLLLVPAVASAQPTATQKKETIKWITDLQAPDGGFYYAPQDPNIDAAPRPMLRATNGAVKALKYLGAAVPNKDKHAAFVLACYDPNTGGFAEPGGKPDVTITSIGVMAACELDIPHAKFAKAMDYLREHAKTFEEVRIGAAAVEAWGVKDCPFKLDEWFKFVVATGSKPATDAKDGGARQTASLSATLLRLNRVLPARSNVPDILRRGQRADGGWGKRGEKASDIESTYRVMRCVMLIDRVERTKNVLQPKELQEVRKFVDSHRNTDGGYATKPGDKSSMSGVYYCVIVSKWLDEMEAK